MSPRVPGSYINDELPAYMAHSMRQARCSNPDAPIVVVAFQAAWDAFVASPAWNTADEEGADNQVTEWATFIPLELLHAATAKHRLFNAVSSLKQSPLKLWHTAVERLLVLEALFTSELIDHERGAYVAHIP